MQKRRLLKLADVIEKTVAENSNLKFDMNTWGRTKKDPKIERGMPACRTAACAMGTAALSGAFNRVGLKHEWQREPSLYDSGQHYWLDISFSYRGKVQYNAMGSACALFDISYEQAEHLFDPNAYPRTKQKVEHVVKRIRDFVANNGVTSK